MCRQEDGYTFMPGDVPYMHLLSSVYSYREKKETDPTHFRQPCCIKCIGEKLHATEKTTLIERMKLR